MHCRIIAFALWYLLLCLMLNACTSSVRAPVVSPGESRQKSSIEPSTEKKPVPAAEKKPDYYIVKKGDTLYSIAWNYGHDYREVAEWNNISAPYVIYPGQKISLVAPPRKKAKPLTPGPIVSRDKPAAGKTTEKKQVTAAIKPDREPQTKQNKSRSVKGTLQWAWPVTGRLVSSDTPISKKGIDIAGNLGQKVNAAGEGEVVYSGSGLLGYGRLIIIKHNDIYLSAYAHNRELLVSEGDYVKAGQNIAHMGQTSNGRTLLHFEIRKNGKPVDPLEYLPKL